MVMTDSSPRHERAKPPRWVNPRIRQPPAKAAATTFRFETGGRRLLVGRLADATVSIPGLVPAAGKRPGVRGVVHITAGS
jgi:hypothetical protein